MGVCVGVLVYVVLNYIQKFQLLSLCTTNPYFLDIANFFQHTKFFRIRTGRIMVSMEMRRVVQILMGAIMEIVVVVDRDIPSPLLVLLGLSRL